MDIRNPSRMLSQTATILGDADCLDIPMLSVCRPEQPRHLIRGTYSGSASSAGNALA
jgi:hypothetical protein